MLSRLSIRQKLILLGTTSALFITLLTGISAYTSHLQLARQITPAQNRALHHYQQSAALIEEIRGDVYGFFIQNSLKMPLSQKNEPPFQELLTALKQLSQSPMTDNAHAQTLALIQSVEHTQKLSLQLLRAITTTTPPSHHDLLPTLHTFRQAMESLKNDIHSLSISLYAQHTAENDAILQEMNFLRHMMTALCVLMVLTLTLFIFYFSRSITSRLNLASNNFEKMAHGDLRQTINIDSSDEISILLKTTNQLQHVLRQTIANLFDAARRVAHSSEAIQSITEEISSHSHTQSQSGSQLITHTQELQQSIYQLLGKSNSSHAAIVHSTEMCTTSLVAMGNALNEMHQVVSTIEDASDQVEKLAVSSSNISHITQVIKEIADQTSLLALNAAIEAARAGEQGRGFAVVADEVRKLSERTADSTLQITSMIEEIRAGIAAAVETIKEGTLHVQKGVDVTQEAHVAMSQLSNANQSMIEVVTEITSTLETHAQATLNLSHQVNDIVKITEQHLANTQDIAMPITRMKEVAEDLKKTSSNFQLG